MTRKYFGTDGIRGTVGQSPVTPDFMLKLGWACGRVFKRASADGGRCTVIIGKDTRVSGYMFESALEAGFVAAGVDVQLLGPMPTPAIAHMTKTLHADAGVVISASHNPYYDNGVKFFSAEGSKLGDELECAIEAEMDLPLECVASGEIGKVVRVVDAAGRYIEFCKSAVPEGFSLRGMKIVVDCAHGATYHIAPSVMSELGADVVPLGVYPDGFNINQGVGSTDTELMARTVVDSGADLGIAFDGDGDRVVFVDNNGEMVDGDELLYIIASYQRGQGNLPEGEEGVVGTLMSNLGLEKALQSQGICFQRARVGDRYVKAMMEEQGWSLGGESSGHIICSEVTTTGDGIIASLQVLRALVAAETDLANLKSGMTKYPQTMINVPVVGKVDLEAHPEVGEAVSEVEAQLGNRGRVLLRPSGTEPLVRVMIEGEDATEVDHLCRSLAGRVGQLIG